jgi:oligopeptide transport system ATP-binding protein
MSAISEDRSQAGTSKVQIAATAGPMLEVRGLTKHFLVRRRLRGPDVVVHAVDNVEFTLGPGQTIGIVGESGSGKTTVGRCILRLLEPTAGGIYLQGQDITRLRRRDLQVLRRKMQMVFQDPADSLNPRFTLRQTLLDALDHAGVKGRAAQLERAEILLEQVGLQPCDLDKFPHQFSGGQQQRIAIARALSFDPILMVLDEPTASLDVSVQTQITNLLRALQQRYGYSYILISHDLSNVRHVTKRVAVMYLGEIVEIGSTEEVFKRPRHPYTRVLIDSVPILDPGARRRRLTLSGEIPSPISPPPGCRFHTRCPLCCAACKEGKPELVSVGPDHTVACHRQRDGA